MKYVAALMIALVLNACANLLMKIGAKAAAGSGGLMQDGPAGLVPAVLRNPTLLFGLACFGLNVFFYMYALQSRSLKISIAYPIMVGGGYALIAIGARLHPGLAERLTWGQLAGVGLVLCGILLLTSQAAGEPVAD